MADTTGLALATLAAVALARYRSTNRGAWLVGAGAALAYATLARWIYGIVAMPFAAYALCTLWQRRRVPAEAVLAVIVAALILGPIVGPPLLNLLRHPSDPAAFAGNFQVYSWSPVNALRHDFFTADGHLEYSLPNGMYYAIAPANLAFFGPLLALAILPGLWAASAWPRQTALLIVGWALSVYAFHAGAPWQNFRFTLAYMPPLAILTAAGVVLAWRRIAHPWRFLAPVFAALGLGVATLGAGRLVERFIDTKDQELALVHWTESEVPPDAQLLTFGPTLAFRHYSALPTFDLFDLSSAELDGVLRQPFPHVVLVDEGSLGSQWQDQAPERNFAHMQVGLKPLGTYGGYTLYRVAAS